MRKRVENRRISLFPTREGVAIIHVAITCCAVTMAIAIAVAIASAG